jgi:hypothetical protein
MWALWLRQGRVSGLTENFLGLSTALSSFPSARARQVEIQFWFLSLEKRKNISLTRFAFEDEHVG